MQKNYLETNSKKTKNLIHRNPKSSQNRVQKSAKITQNLVLGPHVSFHGPLGCPQADKMVLRVVKWRHQACQMIGFGHSK